MGQPKIKSYTKVSKDLMGEKAHILSKAHTLSEVGMLETVSHSGGLLLRMRRSLRHY